MKRTTFLRLALAGVLCGCHEPAAPTAATSAREAATDAEPTDSLGPPSSVVPPTAAPPEEAAPPSPRADARANDKVAPAEPEDWRTSLGARVFRGGPKWWQRERSVVDRITVEGAPPAGDGSLRPRMLRGGPRWRIRERPVVERITYAP